MNPVLPAPLRRYWPALVSLLGRWNWWLPQPLARLMRVRAPRRISTQGATEGVAS